MTEKRTGFKHVTSLPEDEEFVGIIHFRDTIIVASTKHVYRLIKGLGLIPISIQIEDD